MTLQELLDKCRNNINSEIVFQEIVAEHDKQIRAEVIEEVMKKAETIQLEQIENLNKSTRRNGKMWARYMSTYLGHIKVACKRMLERNS